MAKKTIIDTPLSELTFRKYERPENLSKRLLVKKLCLSIGLLQPGDSRDIIVDIFYVLLTEKRRFISSEEVRDRVIEIRQKNNLPLIGIAPSNIRRQLKRLRDIFFVEKVRNKYRIAENSSISEIYREKIVQYMFGSINTRIKEYIDAIDHI